MLSFQDNLEQIEVLIKKDKRQEQLPILRIFSRFLRNAKSFDFLEPRFYYEEAALS